MRFDAPKIAAYRATAAARLGLARTAISAYRVASAISRSPKQEALATVEHAGVLASVGQLDEACVLGCTAYDTAARLGSERTLRAVQRFRGMLGSSTATPVRELDQRLAAAYMTGL
jgi:hypothetical protein